MTSRDQIRSKQIIIPSLFNYANAHLKKGLFLLATPFTSTVDAPLLFFSFS